MVKASTQKSRVLAQAGTVLVLLGLVSDAWLSPPLPRFGVLAPGFAAVIFMAVAKQIRERDGIPIPREVVKEGSSIATLEVSCASIAGLAATVVPLLRFRGDLNTLLGLLPLRRSLSLLLLE